GVVYHGVGFEAGQCVAGNEGRVAIHHVLHVEIQLEAAGSGIDVVVQPQVEGDGAGNVGIAAIQITGHVSGVENAGSDIAGDGVRAERALVRVGEEVQQPLGV